jgi:hypothetical protein
LKKHLNRITKNSGHGNVFLPYDWYEIMSNMLIKCVLGTMYAEMVESQTKYDWMTLHSKEYQRRVKGTPSITRVMGKQK